MRSLTIQMTNSKLEKEWEKTLCKDVLNHLAVAAIKVNILGNVGFPDRIFLMPYKPCWLELKRFGKKPALTQQLRMHQLWLLGYDVAWSDNYEDAYDWLEKIHAARLSKASYCENDIASLRGAALGSRTWKDFHLLSCAILIKE